MFTSPRSTRVAICIAAAALAGCAKKDDTAATDTSGAMASSTEVAAPATLSLADVAGTWNMTSTPTTGNSKPVTYVITATSNTSGWTLTFPGRKPMPVSVIVAGDSIVIDVGPYPSVLRKGVQVTTHGAVRLQDGKLVGSNTAHYNVKTADSVLTLDTQGTRAQ